MMNNPIWAENLSKSFGNKNVLKNVSLSVTEGEIFGLLGPSGAGKTTLIKILTGQLHYQGDAKIMQTHCHLLDREVYEYIGMQLDSCGTYDRLSCMDNLLLFARIHNVEKRRVKEILEYVGLGDGKTIAGKLSKGMMQRLVLARAILHSPKILFLDEPTSGLDPATTQKIHLLMEDLRKQGITIFLTTHNMEEAYRMCTHIALLNEGCIVEYGVPEELCRKYNQDNNVTILFQDGTTVSVKNNPESAPEIAAAFAAGKVESIHSSEPNLETVFMKLTGRGLIA